MRALKYPLFEVEKHERGKQSKNNNNNNKIKDWLLSSEI